MSVDRNRLEYELVRQLPTEADSSRSRDEVKRVLAVVEAAEAEQTHYAMHEIDVICGACKSFKAITRERLAALPQREEEEAQQ